MGHVPGIGPRGPEPSKPIEPEGPQPLKPGDDNKMPNKWYAAVKKFPQLLDAVCKGLALKIMRDSKKKAAKRMKDE